jgi:hypothetical protein
LQGYAEFAHRNITAVLSCAAALLARQEEGAALKTIKCRITIPDPALYTNKGAE